MTLEDFAAGLFVFITVVLFVVGTYAANKLWAHVGEACLFLCFCAATSFVIVGASYVVYISLLGVSP